LSSLDRLAIIGRAIRIGALLLVMVVVVSGSWWLAMGTHPLRSVATVASGPGGLPRPTDRPGDSRDVVITGGSVGVPGVPDVYVVPGVGSFVYLTENGGCYCGPVVYPSGTVFVPPPSGKVTPCRCMDQRNALPVYPIVHIVSPAAPAAPCRCLDTRLSS
jgi:hypothetical protein